MNIDPLVVGIIVIAAIVVLVLASRTLPKRTVATEKERLKQEAREAEQRARDEELQREQWIRQEQARKAQEQARAEAHERKLIADMETEQAQIAFQKAHDELIADIRQKAKEGCDEAFRQRFGVTRPPKAHTPEDDAEVQNFLREHYAELRDAAIEEATEALIQEEVSRRLSSLETVKEEESDDTPPLLEETETESEAAPANPEDKEPEGQAEPGPDGSPAEDGQLEDAAPSPEPDADGEPPEEEQNREPEPELQEAQGSPEGIAEGEGEEDAEEGPDDARRIEAEVREHFDADSIRTYLLAAISARFSSSGKPISESPWPAYTTISPHGYGELHLVKGAPAYAQDAYRAFAWKKFHTGKRAEKPTRGEYSWPETHELGDDAGTDIATPAGTFSVHTVGGPLTLHEVHDCAWVRHDLLDGDSLLVADEQHSFLVSLEGLRKGGRLELRFATEDPFLQDADDSAFTLNAVGQVGAAFIGLSVSNPEAASPGEGPYELTARDGYGFTLQMTADARRHDDDTYPQFIQVNLAWCQPPSLEPENIVRHVTY